MSCELWGFLIQQSRGKGRQWTGTFPSLMWAPSTTPFNSPGDFVTASGNFFTCMHSSVFRIFKANTLQIPGPLSAMLSLSTLVFYLASSSHAGLLKPSVSILNTESSPGSTQVSFPCAMASQLGQLQGSLYVFKLSENTILYCLMFKILEIIVP